MTDEVADLVLADNEAQANALQIASVEAAELVGVHARQIERLERAGVLDRGLEVLPDAKRLQERIAEHRGLTAPELAVLLAFTKIELKQQLVASDLPDDPYFAADLVDYFPLTLRERFGDLATAHPLAREIVATVVANAVVNRAGISFLSRLCDETGCPLPVIARAHVIATRGVRCPDDVGGRRRARSRGAGGDPGSDVPHDPPAGRTRRAVVCRVAPSRRRTTRHSASVRPSSSTETPSPKWWPPCPTSSPATPRSRSLPRATA